MKTIDDYEKAIKAKYAGVNGQYPDVSLLNPTPAGLKNLCLALLDDLNVNDMRVYKHFFSLKDDIDTRRQIEAFDTSRFKILCLFLKGSTKTTSADKLDLLAILLDYQPRPFAKFRTCENPDVIQSIPAKNDIVTGVHDRLMVVDGGIEEDKYIAETSVHEDTMHTADAGFKDKVAIKVNRSSINKVHPTNWILTTVAVFIIIFTFKDFIFKRDECMLWKNDHYEVVPCNTQTSSFVSNTVIPTDKETFTYQKKITACDTTTFFLPDGKPCIWYCKMRDGSIEYFSYPGLHPVTGVTLKKITPYMINKYILSQKMEK